MRDYFDYIALWLPVCTLLLTFILCGFIIRKDDAKLAGFERFIRIFLEEGATLKTWGLFLSSLTLMLVMSTVIAIVASDSSWALKIPLEVQMERLSFLKWMGVGLLVQISIVLGAFGAVAFKAVAPGGASFQLNQAPSGAVEASGSGPAVPPDPKAGV